jgi:S1-C subfamily serine protease
MRIIICLIVATIVSVPIGVRSAPDDSALPDNPFLPKVDAAISTPVATRDAIRRVQPPCVRLGIGSGVNIKRSGLILTNAHVAVRRDKVLNAQFPDGRKYQATCVALDRSLDLALCRIDSTVALPFATVADKPPSVGARVICIGQPGATTPKGEKTGYEPFHVSVGVIRGYLDDPLGSQEKLGRAMHDAWTY